MQRDRARPACFPDGGVVGRIPQNRLYQPGLNILKMWPLPTSSSVVGQRTCEFIRPAEDTLAYQPAVRFDYQAMPTLRVSYKYSGPDQPASRSIRAPSPD